MHADILLVIKTSCNFFKNVDLEGVENDLQQGCVWCNKLYHSIFPLIARYYIDHFLWGKPQTMCRPSYGDAEDALARASVEEYVNLV